MLTNSQKKGTVKTVEKGLVRLTKLHWKTIPRIKNITNSIIFAELLRKVYYQKLQTDSIKNLPCECITNIFNELFSSIQFLKLKLTRNKATKKNLNSCLVKICPKTNKLNWLKYTWN